MEFSELQMHNYKYHNRCTHCERKITTYRTYIYVNAYTSIKWYTGIITVTHNMYVPLMVVGWIFWCVLHKADVAKNTTYQQ